MPEVILVEIAAALAAKTAESLYDLVREKFAGRKKALDTLAAADGAEPGSPQVVALAAELETAEAYDERFAGRLRAEWAAVQNQAAPSGGGVANQISGTVTGNVVQARDIHGDVRFGS
jgi:hypothetical protein